MRLYLVYVEGSEDAMVQTPHTRRLRKGLYLVRSDETRSALYHAVKRRLDPQALLVAPLSDDPGDGPKFKGMEEGALKWLREGAKD